MVDAAIQAPLAWLGDNALIVVQLTILATLLVENTMALLLSRFTAIAAMLCAFAVLKWNPSVIDRCHFSYNV